MRSSFLMPMVVLVAMAGWGCAEHRQPRVVREPLFYVPTAAVVQHAEVKAAGVADQVLPASDGLAYIPRGERSVEANIQVYGYSSYEVFTYDVQRIANRGDGSGYRYRLGWQTGVTVP